MRNLKLTQLAGQLWRDERGFIQSAELVLSATLVVIGMIVGLATFRDATVQELADTGAAVGQLNQSYSVAITGDGGEVGDIITVSGAVDGPVTITGNFGAVTTVSTFNNFSYADQPDLGDGQDLDGLPPGIISISGTLLEGQVLAVPAP